MPTSAPQPVLVEVGSDIKNFTLEDLSVQVGTTVTWTNRDGATHTATAGQPGALTGEWDSGRVSTGSTFTLSFNQPGTFRYFCKIHPSMQATVTVTEEASIATPSPTPTPSPTGGGGGTSGGGYGY